MEIIIWGLMNYMNWNLVFALNVNILLAFVGISVTHKFCHGLWCSYPVEDKLYWRQYVFHS